MSKNYLIIIIAVILIAVALVGGYLFLNQNKSSDVMVTEEAMTDENQTNDAMMEEETIKTEDTIMEETVTPVISPESMMENDGNKTKEDSMMEHN